MTTPRVLIADDLAPVRQTVAELLRGSFEIAASVSDGDSALSEILALQPDCAVLDISMPGMTGIEVARELKKRNCPTKIVFLTVQEDSAIIAACLSSGARGYVIKELLNGDLVHALHEVLAGRVFVSRLAPL